MDELEQIKMQKLEALRQQQMQIAQFEAAVKQLFTKEALSRYSNLRIAHPEKAIQLLAVIGQIVESKGAIKIEDYQLKELLIKMEDNKRDIKINK